MSAAAGRRRGRGSPVPAGAGAIVPNEHVPADEEAPDELTCPLCMDIPEAEVQQCTNGHIFCADCLTAHRNSGRSMSTKCPTCRVDLGGNNRNRIAETAIGNLPGRCAGCATSMPRKELAAHTATCEHIMVDCPFPGCSVRVPRGDLAAHLSNAIAEHLAAAQELSSSYAEERRRAAELQAQLEAAQSRMAASRVHVRFKFDGEVGLGSALSLKRFEIIGEQDAFKNEFAGKNFNDYSFDFDVRRSPHMQSMRDGSTLTAKEDNPTLNIKIVTELRGHARDGEELFFRMKMGTPFSRVLDAFANRQGFSRARLHLFFDGEEVENGDTPRELGVEDGDSLLMRIAREQVLARGV